MSARSVFKMAKNVSLIVRELEDAGMRIELGDDFATYRAYRSNCAGRSIDFPIFDAATSFIDASNGFWICGFDKNDQLVHTQAVRLLDLGDLTLAEHLDTHRHKYIVADSTPDPDQTFFRGPEALRLVTGRVGYCGDFWLAPQGLGGPRSQGATSLLARLVFEVMEKTWRPDFAFAFVPKQLAAKGAHLRYGYSHCEPGRWIGPDQQITHEEYLIWMSAFDIDNLVARDLPTLKTASQIASVGLSVAATEGKG
ncbi:hypothetical protein [Yoonia litorea]|uniref:Uncharacterized protein n=1 Tax=Yoonia litorea TaxID=1123755 RepID=A0A1I6MLT3_9RHOB|nr:hypothetical protein [Yoonia litorea]SFS16611.1 hypothetical protein SAMN05444714_2018 [Yoonia litorea]